MVKRPADLAEQPFKVLAGLFRKAERVEHSVGELVFSEGDPADACYWVEHGLVKVSMASPQGEERVIALLGPGSILGELALIDGEPRSGTVTALQRTTLRRVHRDEFEKLVKANPKTQNELVMLLASRLRKTDEALAAATFLSGKGRLARALLELASYTGENAGAEGIVIKHKLTQSDLAAMTGLARENISRIISEWKRNKIVSRSSSFYCIADARGLKREMEARN
jgi:CRP/FNR family transcriptional regulator, cyclic AMP receptor protein